MTSLRQEIVNDKVKTNSRLSRALTHVIVITMLFVLPEVILTMSSPGEHKRIFWPVYIKAAFYVIVFYINYYIIIPRSFQNSRKPRIWIFLGLNLLLIVLVLVLIHYSTEPFFENFRQGRRHRAPRVAPSDMQMMLKWLSHYLRDGGMLVLTVGLAVALKLSNKWLDLEHRRRDLLAEQRQMELWKLKSQINPHFLFNTLNSIYSLIDLEPESAKKAVHRLSGLLRYMLNDTPTSIPLEKETAFIDDYISLMSLRFDPSKVSYTKDIDDNFMEVPPLILICQIENAFKHACLREPGSKIDIRLSSRKGILRLETFNPSSDKAASTASTGIGLDNLLRRLQLIYGNKARLEISDENGLFHSLLTITQS